MKSRTTPESKIGLTVLNIAMFLGAFIGVADAANHKDWSTCTPVASVPENPKINCVMGAYNGRLTAPKNQPDPTLPVSVVRYFGMTMSCTVENATDYDRWIEKNAEGEPTGEQDVEEEAISYEWTATGGTFVGATNTTTATWKAPTTAGDYIITCKMDDPWPDAPPGQTGVTGDDTGNRNDASVTRTINVKVAGLKITGVKFTSDHDLLRNKTDNHETGGTKYSTLHDKEYELDPPHNYPMTHNWDKEISLELEVERPTDAPAVDVDITGTGLGNFSKTGFGVPAGTGKTMIPMMSGAKLSSRKDMNMVEKMVITIKNEGIAWTINRGGSTDQLAAATTGPHKIYVTVDDPQEGAPGGASEVTVWRMEKANPIVAAAVEVDKEECHPNTVWKIVSNNGVYYLYRYLNTNIKAWTMTNLANTPSDNPDITPGDPDPHGGADCGSIIRFSQNVCMVMGIPGTFGDDTIYGLYRTAAERNRPTVGLSGHCEGIYPGDFDTPFTAGLDPDWFLRLTDGSCKKFGDPNAAAGTVGCGPHGMNVYEATMVYTLGANTYYIPGGTNLLYDNKDSVVQIFQTLAWVNPEDYDADPLTPEGLVVKKVDYSYTLPPSIVPCAP